ncbi:MAG: tRNA dimethylallyltransferase [Mesorhizobium sp.]|nr:MAG: tRNA dimethylallyltransferase [Mesorhizobium sp.]
MSGIETSGQAGEGRVKNAILIAGPTASGKSALALELAEREGGVIVNTDSMQGYSVLDVLTARPGAADLARAPHFLYGHVHPAEGISDMPDIPPAIRDRWRHELKEQGADRLHRILMREDSAVGMQLRPTDGQRIVRALEVLDASGRSIAEWQAARGQPLIDRDSARFLVIEPDRAELVGRIEARFDSMLDKGALEEVKQLMALGLDPDLPAMKAIGVRELQAAMAGQMGFAEAIERAKIATRQYAKRQATWFRHQLGPEWRRLHSAGDAMPAI